MRNVGVRGVGGEEKELAGERCSVERWSFAGGGGAGASWGDFGAVGESDEVSEGADLKDRGREAGDEAAEVLGDMGSKSRERMASACPFVTIFCITRWVRKTRRDEPNTNALERRSSCVSLA